MKLSRMTRYALVDRFGVRWMVGQIQTVIMRGTGKLLNPQLEAKDQHMGRIRVGARFGCKREIY